MLQQAKDPVTLNQTQIVRHETSAENTSVCLPCSWLLSFVSVFLESTCCLTTWKYYASKTIYANAMHQLHEHVEGERKRLLKKILSGDTTKFVVFEEKRSKFSLDSSAAQAHFAKVLDVWGRGVG